MTAYCDFNATSPLKPAVREAIIEAMNFYGNPSSQHVPGRKARGLIENARGKIAQHINCDAANIVFTSGGSESNNTILQHFCKNKAKILVSSIEHASIYDCVQDVSFIPVHPSGVIDLAALEVQLVEIRKFFAGDLLIAVMYANNETGVLQPIAQVVEIAQKYDAKVHCDAVQGLGKCDIDFMRLGVDFMTLSAHKIGGPTGVGAFVFRDGIQATPLIAGGGQERGYRSGTENLLGIVGFGAAVDALRGDDWSHIEGLRDLFEDSLLRDVPDALVFGTTAPRLRNTSCFMLVRNLSAMAIVKFDLGGVYLSLGSACSSGKNKPSHVLQAMGHAQYASCALRASFGWSTTVQDIKKLNEMCEIIYHEEVKKEGTNG